MARRGGHALGDHVHVVVIWSSDRPFPSSSPTKRLRLCVLLHVAVRSPLPARPRKVMGLAVRAIPRRAISARPAGHERRLGVPAVAQPVADAGRDGDHVLDGATDLAADDVGVGEHPERLGGDHVPQPVTAGLVGAGQDGGRRLAGRHLLGQVRAGQHADALRVVVGHVEDDLAHAVAGPDLDALGHADDRGRRRHERPGPFEDRPEVARRDGDQHHLGPPPPPRPGRSWPGAVDPAGRPGGSPSCDGCASPRRRPRRRGTTGSCRCRRPGAMRASCPTIHRPPP